MPVLNHETHDKTILKDGSKYGCYNHTKQPHYYAPDREYNGRLYTVKIRSVIDMMSTECRYDKSLSDARCFGCRHIGGGEEYAEIVRSQGT